MSRNRVLTTALMVVRPVRLSRGIDVYLWPLAVALLFTLFPLDWLATVWPAYAHIFNAVFSTALSHEIGHTTLYFLAGSFILLSVPLLQRRPLRYFGLILAIGVMQEAIQTLFKWQPPTIWSGRDLLCDLLGSTLAFLLLLGVHRLRGRKPAVV